jgi:hypothetical protein
MTERVDLAAFSLRLRTVLQTADASTAGALFGEMQQIRRELEAYREGAQNRTLDAAQQVRRLDRELAELEDGERIRAIMKRTRFSRAKVYRLLTLAR